MPIRQAGAQCLYRTGTPADRRFCSPGEAGCKRVDESASVYHTVRFVGWKAPAHCATPICQAGAQPFYGSVIQHTGTSAALEKEAAEGSDSGRSYLTMVPANQAGVQAVLLVSGQRLRRSLTAMVPLHILFLMRPSKLMANASGRDHCLWRQPVQYTVRLEASLLGLRVYPGHVVEM